MEWTIGKTPRVLRRTQVARIGFPRDFEKSSRNTVGHGWFRQEPGGPGPRLQNGRCGFAVLLMQLFYVVKGIKTRSVDFNCSAAAVRISTSCDDKSWTSVATLYPSSTLRGIQMLNLGLYGGQMHTECGLHRHATALRKAALTYAASSTPGGTRWTRVVV